MTATLETHVLDGLALTDGNPFWLAESPAFAPAPLRPEWVGGPDTDGAMLLEEPFADNIMMTLKLRISEQTTADLAAAKVGQLLDKLALAARNGTDGIEDVWSPRGQTATFSLVVLLGELVGVPMDDRGVDEGWLTRSPVLTVRLTCKPFVYGAWLDTFSDAFATNTIADYTLDQGSGTISVSGGQLVPSSTAEKNLIHTASPYAFENARAMIKVTTGASVASGIAGPILKRLDATNHLAGQVTFAGASSVVRIVKRDAGTFTTVASSSVFTASAATPYWVRVRQQGNVLTAEVFTAVPTATRAATRSASFTLTGADITKYGTGITGRTGIRFQPAGTDWRVDDLTVEPHVFVGSTPALEWTLSAVPGDVAAEGKLTFTDSAGQVRRHLEVGIDPEYSSAASSFIAKANLITSGFAGIPATLSLQTTAAFGTGTLTHVGSWRIKLVGAQVSSSSVQVRLAYRSGDGSYATTPWVTPAVNAAETEIDLGVIHLAEAVIGTQAWDGRVEAVSSNTALTDTLSMPNASAGLLLIPVDGGYMKARARIVDRPGVQVARDEFTSITAATALNARAAPVGGTWATSGAATDFVAADAPTDPSLPTGAGSPETMTRATVGDTGKGRIAVLGATSYTDVDISVSYYATSAGSSGLGNSVGGPIARYVDANNHLYVVAGAGSGFLFVYKWIAGSSTQLAAIPITTLSALTWYVIRVVVFASGVGYATVTTNAGALIARADFSDSALATGGTLATGKPAFYDWSAAAAAVTRYYDNFAVFTPPTEPRIIESGKTAVLRHDSAWKESSAGGTYGLLTPRGARVFVPPAGSTARSSRWVAKARRIDADAASDANLTDSLTVQRYYGPGDGAPPAGNRRSACIRRLRRPLGTCTGGTRTPVILGIGRRVSSVALRSGRATARPTSRLRGRGPGRTRAWTSFPPSGTSGRRAKTRMRAETLPLLVQHGRLGWRRSGGGVMRTTRRSRRY